MLRGMLSILVICFTGIVSAAEGNDFPAYAILQGPTSDSQTQFSVWAPASHQVQVRVVDFTGRTYATEQFRISDPSGKSESVHVIVKNLRYPLTYKLEVTSLDQNYLDQRTFNLLSPNSLSRPLRVALLSCAADVFHNVFAWKELENSNPDVVIVSGDAVYLDRPHLIGYVVPKTEEDIWKRHARAREKIYFYRMKHLIPTVTSIDDHDFGYNDALEPWPLGNAAKQIYDVFFPRHEIPGVFERGPGMSARFQFSGQQFLLMDNRSFQSRAKEGDYYGYLQEAWLQRMATAPQVWLVSGSQFFGGYLEKDSYQYNHPDDFDRFIRLLKGHPSHFNFLTGDIHFSEMMKIPAGVLGYPSFEITSSSMHSGSFPGRHKFLEWLGWKNPWRIGATSTHNFALIEMSPPGLEGVSQFKVDFVSWRGAKVFQSEQFPLSVQRSENCDDIVNPVIPRNVR